MIREPDILIGVLSNVIGHRYECSNEFETLGGRYTNTRNRVILDTLIREKVEDVEVIGMKKF